jgi:hypothetical protein
MRAREGLSQQRRYITIWLKEKPDFSDAIKKGRIIPTFLALKAKYRRFSRIRIRIKAQNRQNQLTRLRNLTF